MSKAALLPSSADAELPSSVTASRADVTLAIGTRVALHKTPMRAPLRSHRSHWMLVLGAFVLVSACGPSSPNKKPVVQQAQATTVRPAPKPKPTLKDLAKQAMSKLEAFLQRTDVDRSMRAQAMFRLAGLHDDLADENPVVRRNAAITLYMQIIGDFPESDVATPSHYFLAGDLETLVRMKEAQHVYRALVCHNHFVLTPPKDPPAAFAVPPLPQERDRAYWEQWNLDHRVPLDKLPKKQRERAGVDTTFVNPYPDDCQPLRPPNASGPLPAYIADAWWRIGDQHFSMIDMPSGPYELNLAAVAYRHAIRLGETPLRNYAMYKLAWTYFKQERYAAAVAQFIEYLRYDDAHPSQKQGIAVVSDLRAEATTYIAISLLFVDFQGPGPDDPLIPREDVLDTEKDPRVAEKKLHVAIDRVKDSQIIPQNEIWTREIYAALFHQFRDLTYYRNHIELGEVFLSKWPDDPRAGEVRQMMELARTRLGKP